MKTLYIHIGTPKTATTSLQLFFHDNQKLLKEKGFSYPIMAMHYPYVRIQRNGHFLIADEGTEKGENWEKGIAVVHKEFETCDNVILTDEKLWRSSLVKNSFYDWLLEDSKEYQYQIKVIVYLRRQDEYAASLIAQQVKTVTEYDSVRKWDNYKTSLSQDYLNYWKILNCIQEKIGKENITVRIFERNHFLNGSIFDDFMSILGLSVTDEYVFKTDHANLSITGNRQEIQRIMNTVISDNGSLRTLCMEASGEAEKKKDPANDYAMFSAEEIKEIMDKYGPGNQKVAETFFGSGEPLFHEDVKEKEVWTPENPYMYEDIIRYFGALITKQQEKIDSLTRRIYLLENGQTPENALSAKWDAEDITLQLKNMHNQIYTLSRDNIVAKDEISGFMKKIRKENDAQKKKIKNLEKSAILLRIYRKLKKLTNSDS